MGKLLKLLFSHVFVIGLLIFLQMATFLFIITYLSSRFTFVYGLLSFISILFVIYLFSENKSMEYKLIWALVIMLFPLFGGLFYLLWGKRSTDWKVLHSLKVIYGDTTPLLPTSHELMDNLSAQDRDLGLQAQHIYHVSHMPLYAGCDAEYFPIGEEAFASMLKELEKADRFICLEFFIISPGVMWDSILSILKRKVKQGVEVYMLYDDAGSVARVPKTYDKTLQRYGIHAWKFNPLRAQMYTFMNYRDHRKILVIDGKVGYMGGINLADEYINQTVLHGHWKDTAFLIRGDAVWSMTLMFFQLYTFASKERIDLHKYHMQPGSSGEGYVQPYGDDPLDEINVAEDAYINIINRSKKYVYITTPYLILDSELVSALTLAARSGVDVRILTPHIPDKKLVFEVTQSNYRPLVQAGVKIYEYTPGFVHAKMFVSDDKVAVVGTANLDYRSLYLHFECCTAFYLHRLVLDVKQDFLQTLEISQAITWTQIQKTSFGKRIARSLLRVIAPLL